MQKWADRFLSVVTLVATVAAASVVYARYHQPKKAEVPITPTKFAGWRSLAQAGHRVGPPSSPITLTIFSDYQCPYCRALSLDVANIRKQWPTQIAVVWRDYPLAFHPHSREAAAAAACAAEQGQFENMNALLFANQAQLGVESWRDFAAQAGVTDLPEFDACINGRSVLDAIARDSIAAASIGVHGTPTFLLNEYKFVGSPGRDSLDSYIRRLLKS